MPQIRHSWGRTSRTPARASIRRRVAVAAAVWLAAAPAAHATLGGARDGVDRDQASLAASLSSTAATTHTVHALTLANGVVAREFIGASGVVFAVTWHGPARPDLRQLLGSYFNTLQADNAPRAGRRTRAPLAVNRSDFVVESGGHSGAFWGVAFLPKMAPAGFSASALAASR